MRWCFSREKSLTVNIPATSMKTESSSNIEPRIKRSASIFAGSPFSSAMEDEDDDMMQFPHDRTQTGRKTRAGRDFSVDAGTALERASAGLDRRISTDFHRSSTE